MTTGEGWSHASPSRSAPVDDGPPVLPSALASVLPSQEPAGAPKPLSTHEPAGAPESLSTHEPVGALESLSTHEPVGALESPSSQEAWLAPSAAESSDIVTVIDHSGVVLYQTPSAARVLGHAPGTWARAAFTDLVRPDQHTALRAALSAAGRQVGQSRTLELALATSSGGWRLTETTVTAISPDDSSYPCHVLTSRDITDRRRLRDLLEAQAETDDLTGRANLTTLRRQTMEALRTTPVGQVALLVLDLDAFSTLNDELGRLRGDELLVLVGASLAKSVRPWDVVARIGDDEFAVLVVGSHVERSVLRIQDRVRRAISGMVLADGVEVQVRTSAGYAINDTGSETAEDLLRNADLALSRARGSRRVEILRFERHMHEQLVERVQASSDLRRAFERGEFELHYQPIVWLPGRRWVGAESLVRWRHPTRGLLSAAEFVPMIEQLGLGARLGEWVVDAAARALATVLERFPYDDLFKVGFNVSADQLEPGLVDLVLGALREHGVPPDRFVVEVTESSIALAESATPVINALRDAGVKVGIDDFGVGYSSLGYLATFPVDYLKVDSSFVRDIENSPARAALTEAIIVLGEALSLPPIVEGVETEEQLEVLYAAGCRYVQGWLFAKAMPLTELLTVLDAQSRAVRTG